MKERVMEPRIDYAKTAPEVRAAMMGLEQYVPRADLIEGSSNWSSCALP